MSVKPGRVVLQDVVWAWYGVGEGHGARRARKRRPEAGLNWAGDDRAVFHSYFGDGDVKGIALMVAFLSLHLHGTGVLAAYQLIALAVNKRCGDECPRTVVLQTHPHAAPRDIAVAL